MIAKETRDFLEDFYNLISDEYPNYDLNQIKEVCRTPFTLLKNGMKSRLLYEVRLKYLGVFKPVPNYILNRSLRLTKAYANDNLSEELYEYKINSYLNFLKKYDEENQTAKVERYYSLLAREPEIQALLQQKQASQVIDEDSHQGADRLQDQSDGSTML